MGRVLISIVGVSVCLWLFLSGCHPVGKLYEYEMAEELSVDSLYVLLKNNDREIGLFRKYNETRKAERLQSKQDKYYTSVKSAFAENFDFCPVAYSYTKLGELVERPTEPPRYYCIFRRKNIMENDDNEKEVMTMEVFLIENGIKHPSKQFSVSNSGDTSNRAYPYLVRQMDKKLSKLYQKGMEKQNGN